MDHERRQLVAILAADVVGYSRLMADDESGTLRRLKVLRSEIVDPTVAAFHGRFVGSAGDSFLAEFPSASDAVRCAVEIQEQIAGHNVDLPTQSQMIFRVGVNLGDVIADGETIYGDGVTSPLDWKKAVETGRNLCLEEASISRCRAALYCIHRHG
jgi:adenylate cyclase